MKNYRTISMLLCLVAGICFCEYLFAQQAETNSRRNINLNISFGQASPAQSVKSVRLIAASAGLEIRQIPLQPGRADDIAFIVNS